MFSLTNLIVVDGLFSKLTQKDTDQHKIFIPNKISYLPKFKFTEFYLKPTEY